MPGVFAVQRCFVSVHGQTIRIHRGRSSHGSLPSSGLRVTWLSRGSAVATRPSEQRGEEPHSLTCEAVERTIRRRQRF